MTFSLRTVLAAIPALALAGGAAAAHAGDGWHSGHNHKVRLLADQGGAAWAGVEIAMTKGWKTYWRAPGDAGGVPPSFDWSKSQNLKSATVLYPAPVRLVDKGGETIGYKDHVLFPVKLEPVDPAKPVQLALAMSFGVCRDICIPAEAELGAVLPAAVVVKPPAEPIATAVGLVPPLDPPPATSADLPSVSRFALDAVAARLVVDARFPAAAPDADAFIEGPEGVYIPMTAKAAGAPDGQQRFVADLAGIDLKDLKGQTVTITLVGGGKSCETRRRVE